MVFNVLKKANEPFISRPLFARSKDGVATVIASKFAFELHEMKLKYNNNVLFNLHRATPYISYIHAFKSK
jgi:hypothetical protein